MRALTVAARATTIALVVGVVFRLGALPALGWTSPAALSLHTMGLGVIAAEELAPGSLLSEQTRVVNTTSLPVDYRLIFVPQGGLWRCDPGGSNLYYRLEWQAGADQHLEPGESETVTVTLHLPLAAGNGCQGARGRLLVRQGWVEHAGKRGVYECRPLPIHTNGKGKDDPAGALGGCYCWDVSMPLHHLLGHP